MDRKGRTSDAEGDHRRCGGSRAEEEQEAHGEGPRAEDPLPEHRQEGGPVTRGGKITARGKGTCTVYVFAHNGVRKAVKVTVR